MIYLDNAATSFPKPEEVYKALDTFARTKLANPGRSAHAMSAEAERLLDQTRGALNRMFQGETPERWVFTLNCTDALNIAIKGVIRPGDHVITSDLEHNSISRPLEALARAGVIALTRVKARAGYLDPGDIRAAWRPETRLVAVTHASNVLGTVQPIAEIAALVRRANARILVDAAQTAGAVTINLKETPIDLLAFPGHKSLYGPTGTGALYVGPRTELTPWREGGTGGDSKNPVQPEELPYRLEGGTPNALGIAGLFAGISWIEARGGPEALRKHELELLEPVVEWARARSAEGWGVAGGWDADRHVGVLSLKLPQGAVSQELATQLDAAFGIAVRAGLHCAPYAHRAEGTFPDGTLRISVGALNTPSDISALLSALGEWRTILMMD